MQGKLALCGWASAVRCKRSTWVAALRCAKVRIDRGWLDRWRGKEGSRSSSSGPPHNNQHISFPSSHLFLAPFDITTAGHLTRDPRAVERKKPGQKKARKKFQWCVGSRCACRFFLWHIISGLIAPSLLASSPCQGEAVDDNGSCGVLKHASLHRRRPGGH